jgi:phospholipid transport system substrate-binding protein
MGRGALPANPWPSRRAVLGGLVVVLPCAASAQGGASRGGNPQAEAFVQSGAQNVLSILADRRMSRAAKEASFRQLIDQLVDVPRITSFVLGKYARTITPAQRQAFNAAFRTYAESVYQRHIEDFDGQTLRITGSVARKPDDVVVNSVIGGEGKGAGSKVAWRVLAGGGGWKVVDVQISGVWLAITEQQDFVSTIDNAGGDIGVLIAQLQRDSRGRAQSR